MQVVFLPSTERVQKLRLSELNYLSVSTQSISGRAGIPDSKGRVVPLLVI